MLLNLPPDHSNYSSMASSSSITFPPLDWSWDIGYPDVNTLQSSSSSLLTPPTPPPQLNTGKTQTAKARSTRSRRRRSPSYIPRPRNAFMIFRSDFYNKKTIDDTIEHDHRHISRIIGCCWRNLSKEDQRCYKERAQQEADLHKLKYPDYRYQPVHRKPPVQRRNVKRNGTKDKIRCQAIADLITQGKSGNELQAAIKELDASLAEYRNTELNTLVLSSSDTGMNHRRSASPSYPIFRSPLIAPIEEEEVGMDGSACLHTASPPASLFCGTSQPESSVQSQINTTNDHVPFVIDWANGGQSSMVVPQRAQEMLTATSDYLQQAHDLFPVSFNLPLFPQYVATFPHAPTPHWGPSSRVTQASLEVPNTFYQHVHCGTSAVTPTPYTSTASSFENLVVPHNTGATVPEVAEWSIPVHDAFSGDFTTIAAAEQDGQIAPAFPQWTSC